MIILIPVDFKLQVDHERIRLVAFASRKAVPVFGHSAAPNPLTYVASLVFYDPLGAGIGQKVTGWHCRRSSLARQTILGDNLLGISVVFFAVVRIRVKEPCRVFFCVFSLNI